MNSKTPVLELLILLAITFTVKSQLTLLGPLEANLGDPLDIVCVASSLAPSIAILEETTPITNTLTETFANDTVRAFQLPNTQRSDNGRRLACQLGIITPLMTVTIIYFDSIQLMPVFNDPFLTVTEDSNVDVIRYVIMASPEAVITLTRTDGMPPSSRFQVTQTALTISGVSRADAGSYNLTFMHRATSNVMFYEFTLEVEYGPEFNVTVIGTGTNCVPHPADSEDFFCTTKLGMNVVIMCPVSANPPATLRVSGEENGVTVENDGSSLATITVGLTMDNLGVYRCIANNTVAERSIDIELSLFDPPTTSPDDDTTTTVSAAPGTLRLSLIITAYLTVLLLLFRL